MNQRRFWSLFLGAVFTSSQLLAASPFPCLSDGTCTSGYLPANAEHNTQLFYVFYPSTNPNAPLAIWLQGGPGCSDTPGQFAENIGPYTPTLFNGQTVLNQNPYTWNSDAHLLFIDSPANVGYSYANYPNGATDYYVGTSKQAAEDLYEGLQQFYEKYPQLKSNPLILTGESYAGHYIPAFASLILQNNAAGMRFVNLRGCAIGDAWFNPVTQVAYYAEFFNARGLINDNQRAQMETLQNGAIDAMNDGRWVQASTLCSNVVNMAANMTNVNIENVDQFDQFDDSVAVQFLQRNDVKAALGVPSFLNFSSDCSDTVYGNFTASGDIAQSVIGLLPNLLSQMPLLFWQGTNDGEVPAKGVEESLRSTPWWGQSAFNALTPELWIGPSGTPAGYRTQYGNLTYVNVEDAGHMDSLAQPANMQALFRWFVAQVLGTKT
jgi:carboxypeptidase C (cathepsin A)